MNNQYPQSNQPAPQYIPPQKPFVDPAKAKKEKTDAINELGDKVSAVLKTSPILASIEKNAEIFSYIATTACFLLTIVLMTMGNFQIFFGVISVIFGFFALSKKKVLPLTVAMTVYSLFSLVCFINSIVHIIQVARYGFYASVIGAAILGMIFSLLELGAVGFLTYIVWTYHLATVPAKRVQRQNYYGQPDQRTHNAQYAQQTQQTVSQPAAPVAPVAQPAAQGFEKPVRTVEPILDPIVASKSVAPAENVPISHKFCTSCGTENNADALFCKNCGKKF